MFLANKISLNTLKFITKRPFLIQNLEILGQLEPAKGSTTKITEITRFKNLVFQKLINANGLLKKNYKKAIVMRSFLRLIKRKLRSTKYTNKRYSKRLEKHHVGGYYRENDNYRGYGKKKDRYNKRNYYNKFGKHYNTSNSLYQKRF
jgi:hypothetical protein